MANNSNVGKTVGIVLGITAAVGLGLYLILRPKKATAANNTIPTYSPTGSASQVALLEAQIAALQQKQKNESAFLTEQAKAANRAQLNSLVLQLGAQFASKGLNYWSSTWGNSGSGGSSYDQDLAQYDVLSGMGDY